MEKYSKEQHRVRYKNKFEEELTKKVALRANISEKDVFIIYKSFMKGIWITLSNPILSTLYIPLLGRFYSTPRILKSLLKKEEKVNYVLNTKARNDLINWDYLVNLKYYIKKLSNNNN